MAQLKTNKDLREMLSGALGLIEKMLPIVNESFLMSQAAQVAVCEMNAEAGKRLLERIQKNSVSSIELVAEPLALIQDYQRYLDDDSLWSD